MNTHSSSTAWLTYFFASGLVYLLETRNRLSFSMRQLSLPPALPSLHPPSPTVTSNQGPRVARQKRFKYQMARDSQEFGFSGSYITSGSVELRLLAMMLRSPPNGSFPLPQGPSIRIRIILFQGPKTTDSMDCRPKTLLFVYLDPLGLVRQAYGVVF